MSQTTRPIPAPRIKESMQKLKSNIAKVIRGKDEVIDQVLVSLVAGGHVLIEDLPGLGKTTLAYCLARSLDCSFSRIQFTSDLLPSDVIGVSIYDEQMKEFVFKKGPIFGNVVLADEINRTTPKTQSALLEVMDRGKVSVDGQTYNVGQPFTVFATQNPVDYEGTFPLPESQMDRFLMRLQMGYPDYQFEMEILANRVSRQSYDTIDIEPVLTRQEVAEIQHFSPQVFVEESILHYMLRFATATRTESEFLNGVSTRGTIALKAASQAYALYQGRGFVVPEDVSFVLKPVFTHRLSLRRQSSDPLEERRAVEGILNKLLDTVKLPD
ncbi:MoxR family ATPase [Rubellicoccus peritrichatus]|uniref:MoxR family ATPase n=1 Tax=Rubellicoccus peritrichatus TaxID=3080537 RepID=A0AAQ3QVM9_9BACT|nr:MoxR family ATPase [Puniceicoccus sp. CR14]WOO40982.1 MoxR family ATPase [Puniceicoccus sp. CR14]